MLSVFTIIGLYRTIAAVANIATKKEKEKKNVIL